MILTYSQIFFQRSLEKLVILEARPLGPSVFWLPAVKHYPLPLKSGAVKRRSRSLVANRHLQFTFHQKHETVQWTRSFSVFMHNTVNTSFLLELMEVASEPSCFLITSVDSCTCAVSIGRDVRIRNFKKKSMKGGLNRRGQSSRVASERDTKATVANGHNIFLEGHQG